MDRNVLQKKVKGEEKFSFIGELHLMNVEEMRNDTITKLPMLPLIVITNSGKNH